MTVKTGCGTDGALHSIIPDPDERVGLGAAARPRHRAPQHPGVGLLGASWSSWSSWGSWWV